MDASRTVLADASTAADDHAGDKETSKQWVEQLLQKRECIHFIPSHRDRHRCCCGRAASKHDAVNVLVAEVSVARVRQKWTVQRHTALMPTDAYGTINFQGGPHPNKAQYIRLSYDTPVDVILRIFHEHWGLDLPKLLISVHGGLTNFELPSKLKRIFRRGLHKTAKTAGAWIITAGTNVGVMKQVGDALGDWMTQAKNNIVTIGIAPWGIVHSRNELIGRDIEAPYYSSASHGGSTGIALNSNHSYFLLVDNGTVGKYGCEITFRRRLEKHISHQKIRTRTGMSTYGVPVVHLVLEGGLSTIHSVVDAVTDQPPVPVVVIDGSGRSADLLATAHRLVRNDGTMSEAAKQQLASMAQQDLQCGASQAEKVVMEMVICMRKKSLVTVFRNNGEGGAQDLDMAILTALLAAQNATPSDQLSLALAWNRVDIARGHVFGACDLWRDETLDAAMMDALINDRTEFVQLLLEKGVSMQRWLTIGRLEELYNADLQVTPAKNPLTAYSQRKDDMTTLRHLVKDHKKHIPFSYRYTLLDIGLVIDSLMGGAYRSTYSRSKFSNFYHSHVNLTQSQQAANMFRYPFHELMVWAVLLHRQKMAKFMWQHGEETLAKALVACKLYKSMAKEAEQDDFEIEICQKLSDYSKEFANLACELLDHCYQSDDDVTLQLLTYRLKWWSDETCLSLAHACALKEFIAHPCCQMLLTQMWMGAMRLRKYTPIRIMLGLLVPPTIIYIEFKTFDELRLLPQTAEEHIHGMSGDSDSENSSIMGSDDEADEEHLSDDEEERAASPQQPQIQVTRPPDGSESTKSMHSVPGVTIAPIRHRRLSAKKKLFEFYTAPITKFWLHTLGFLIYLALFTYVVLIKWSMMPQWQECYATAYIFAMLIDKIFEIIQSDPRTFVGKILVHMLDFWNFVDMVIILLVLAGLPLRLASEDTLLHGRVCYCVAASLSYVRLFDVFSISRFLGPYVYMMAKMIPQMAQCCMVLLIILVTFGIVRQSIVYPHIWDWDWYLLTNVFLKPYFNIYGEVYAEEIDPVCGEGPSFDFECAPGRWIFPTAFAVYMVLAAILLLSMLIAVISTTYNRLYNQTTQIWMFRRYGLVIEYEAKTLVPPPFSVISRLLAVSKLCCRKCRHRPDVQMSTGLRLYLSDAEIEKVHDFEEECVEMYFLIVEQKLLATNDERIRVLSERMELISNRLDDLVHRDKLRTVVHAIDARLADIEAMTTGRRKQPSGETVVAEKALHRSLPANFLHRHGMSNPPRSRHHTASAEGDEHGARGPAISVSEVTPSGLGLGGKGDGLSPRSSSDAHVLSKSASATPKVRQVSTPSPRDVKDNLLSVGWTSSGGGATSPAAKVSSPRSVNFAPRQHLESGSERDRGKTLTVTSSDIELEHDSSRGDEEIGKEAGSVFYSPSPQPSQAEDTVSLLPAATPARPRAMVDSGTQTDIAMGESRGAVAALSPHVLDFLRSVSHLASPGVQLPSNLDAKRERCPSDEMVTHKVTMMKDSDVEEDVEAYSDPGEAGDYESSDDEMRIKARKSRRARNAFKGSADNISQRLDSLDDSMEAAHRKLSGSHLSLAASHLSLVDDDRGNTLKSAVSMEGLFYRDSPPISLAGSAIWDREEANDAPFLHAHRMGNDMEDEEGRRDYNRQSSAADDEELKRAEEGMNVAMEMMVRRRIRTISLTRDDSMAVIARATDAKMVDVSEEPAGYHSDGDSATFRASDSCVVFHAYSDSDLAVTSQAAAGSRRESWHEGDNDEVESVM